MEEYQRRITAKAAEQLGLEATGCRAAGEYQGRPIVLEVTFRNNGNRPLAPFFHLRAPIDPPLDLGLSVRRAVFRGLLPPEITGDPALDGELLIEADEDARARAVFTAELRGFLLRLLPGEVDVRLDDEGAWQQFGYEVSMPELATVLVDGAKLLEQARPRIPPAHHLAAHAEALQRAAASHGLARCTAPLGVRGVADGREIAVTTTRTGPARHHLGARVAFVEPLGVGLSLRRQTLLDDVAVLFGGEDAKTGDRHFDARFLVRASGADPRRVAALFDEGVRAKLLDLDARFGAIVIHDEGITIDPIAEDAEPDALPDLVEGLLDASGDIEAMARASTSGPYR